LPDQRLPDQRLPDQRLPDHGLPDHGLPDQHRRHGHADHVSSVNADTRHGGTMSGLWRYTVLGLGGCAGEPRDEVLPIDLPDEVDRWEREGAVEIVPPLHLPQPEGGSVSVWLSLPAGAELDLERAEDDQLELGYPPGTVADRVETRGQGAEARLVDVRGTRIDESGRRWHHVYRAAGKPGSALVGMEWPAGDADLHALAVQRFLERLRSRGVRDLGAVARKLDCDGCHSPGRPDNRLTDEFGLVARGTDSAGFFTPSTVLRAEGVLEQYGQRDPNVEDPFVVASCAEGEPSRPVPGPGAHWSCPDRQVPRARLQLASALAAGDEHARAVCASWRYLVEHLPPEAVAARHPCRETP
jgi:hypothetical protein